MENEVYYGLVGKWLTKRLWVAKGLWPTTGGPVHVKFNPEDIIKRQMEKGDIIGFYHTHPQMPNLPSSTDVDTMNAWVDCLGKPLICLIDGTGYRGKPGIAAYYWYGPARNEIGRVFKYEEFFFGLIYQKRKKED